MKGNNIMETIKAIRTYSEVGKEYTKEEFDITEKI